MSDAECAKLVRGEHLVAELDGETVVLNAESGVYFSLNETAAAVWEALDEPREPGDLVRRVVQAFDVDEARAREDLGGLIASLLEAGLVEWQDATPA